MPTIKLTRPVLKALTDAAGRGRATMLFAEDQNPDSGVMFTPGKPVTFFDTETRGFGVRFHPSGSAAYVLHYRPHPGGRSTPKRVFTIGAVGDMTLEAAKDAAGDMKAGIRVNGADPMEEKQAKRKAGTLYDLIRAYLDEHVKPDRKATTLASYEAHLRIYIAPRRDDSDPQSPFLPGVLGSKRAVDVKRPDVNKLRLKIGEKHTRTANAVVALISAAYVWGEQNAPVLPAGTANPARGVKRYPETKRERALEDAEWERLADALTLLELSGLPWRPNLSRKKHTRLQENRRTPSDPYAVACIRLLIFTGCRLREILNLQWAHVDFERGLLKLPDSKTGAKIVPLSNAALEVLQGLQPTNYKYVIAGETAGTERERPRADLHRPWARIIEHAGLGAVGVKGEDGYRAPLRIHDLRHAHAGNAVEIGANLVLLGKLLGHKNPSTTARYANPVEGAVRDVANANSASIKAKMAGKTRMILSDQAIDRVIVEKGLVPIVDGDDLDAERRAIQIAAFLAVFCPPLHHASKAKLLEPMQAQQRMSRESLDPGVRERALKRRQARYLEWYAGGGERGKKLAEIFADIPAPAHMAAGTMDRMMANAPSGELAGREPYNDTYTAMLLGIFERLYGQRPFVEWTYVKKNGRVYDRPRANASRGKRKHGDKAFADGPPGATVFFVKRFEEEVASALETLFQGRRFEVRSEESIRNHIGRIA